ncbi:MAG: sporulation protein YqfD [Clostridia bacterium]|nr:sporulation protein YqfD [Clostridia bacterium]
MFLQNTYRFTVGYVEIQVEGYFVERFLNLCLNRNIEVWDINRKYDGIIILKLHHYDLEKINEIAEVTKTEVKILKKNGVPHIANLYSKRKIFLMISILVMILIYLASQRIWQIAIIGDFSFPLEEIENELLMEKVKVGMHKDDLDFDSIKNRIYVRRSDILWMGFEINGVKLTVEVLERTDPPKDALTGKPCDIISDKDGIIAKIFVREGTKLKNVGDVVVKGETLVSRSGIL